MARNRFKVRRTKRGKAIPPDLWLLCLLERYTFPLYNHDLSTDPRTWGG